LGLFPYYYKGDDDYLVDAEIAMFEIYYAIDPEKAVMELSNAVAYYKNNAYFPEIAVKLGSLLEKVLNERGHKLFSKVQGVRYPDLKDSNDIIAVAQGEYGFTIADSSAPFIKTCWASDCIILVMYNAKRKVGMVAHIDNETDIETGIRDILVDFRELGANINDLQATIIARAVPSNKGLKKHVRSLLGEFFGMRDVRENYYGVDDRNIALDTKTGIIYNLTDIIIEGPSFDNIIERGHYTLRSQPPRILRRYDDPRSLSGINHLKNMGVRGIRERL
jgi:hypothetical protein